MVYVSLLRGININGHNLIKMQVLRDLYTSLKLKNVKTYIQSGNVVFDADKDTDTQKLVTKIEKALKKKHQLDVRVFINTLAQFKRLVANNPFDETSLSCFILLSAIPKKADYQKIFDLAKHGEKVEFKKNVAYCFYPQGQAKTKIVTNNFEKKLAMVGTMRNMRTARKILELVDKQ